MTTTQRLLPPAVLAALDRAVRESLPFVGTGEVVIELNYAKGTLAPQYISLRLKQYDRKKGD